MTELLWLLLPWSLAFVFAGRMRRCPPLPKRQDRSRTDEIRVSVIIPARNEERRLGPLLESLRTQDYANRETIVVDDNSTDGTADLARGFGATTLTLSEPEPGWLGKPYACWQGARQSSGDLLVFLDADTVLEPGGLRRIVATHARYGGLVSVLPYHRMEKAYERLSAFFFVIAIASIRSFTLAGSAIKPNGSFGPCIVCSRDVYFDTGGHRLVRAAVVDDLALSRALGQRGVPTHNFIGAGTIAFRMYPGGLRDLSEGWTKNFAYGAKNTDLAMLVLIAAWVSSSSATIDALRGWPVHGFSNWAVAGMASYCAYVLQLRWMLGKLGNYGFGAALAYPVSLVFFCWVFARSLYLTWVRNSVRWKGRSIPVRSPGEST